MEHSPSQKESIKIKLLKRDNSESAHNSMMDEINKEHKVILILNLFI